MSTQKHLAILILFFMPVFALTAQNKGPEIKFDNIQHDYGEFREDGGKANHTFYFTNTGDDTLMLTNVRPGCGCTASNWTKTPILPGEKGMVTAAYDPKGRPGPFKKSILVQSNAKNSPNISLFISGKVIPKPKDYTDTFRIHLGDLLFERNSSSFHNLDPDAYRTDTIRFINNYAKDMTVAIKESPAHIEAKLSASKYKPMQRGYMVIHYNAAKTTSGSHNDRILLQTNDPKQETKLIFVSSTINPKKEKMTIDQAYPYTMGNLAFTRNNFVFPQIMNTETKSDSIEVYNKGEKAIKIDFKKPASHIDVSIEPTVILPGKTAVIHLTYDASQTGTFGFKSNDRLHLQTDDSLQVTKVIYISANIKEDFSGLTKEELENAPAVHFEEKIFDFGERPNNENVTHSYIFSNTGKSDLTIRKVHASCGCTATHPAKSLLKPGETSKIDIVFNTKNRVGKQFKSITVITNDPKSPEVLLQIKGELTKAE